MRNPFSLIFPGMIIGIVCLIVLTGLLSTPSETAQAAVIPNTGAVKPTLTPTPVGNIQPVQNQPEPKGLPAYSGCELPSRYPAAIRQWCGLIQQEAQKNGIDARLIAAVMLQESGGNAKAYSRSGAVGLLQVMPRDGLAASFKCKNGPCFASRPSMAELYDPAFNINYGARMLSGLIKKTGSPREALKSYGPMDMGYGYADKVLAIYNNYK